MTCIGFIGVGNMGSAIIRGLAPRGDVTLMGYDLNSASLAALAPVGLRAAASPRELAEGCDIVLLAVKPHQVKAVLEEIGPALNPGRTVLSIAAGVTMKKLVKWADPAPVVRVMPNTPAMVGAGVFALCLEDDRLGQERKDFLVALFQGLGQVHVLPEKLFDAFTAVAGSGPAYVFYFIDAVHEAGVTLGLTRQQATEMVQGLFTGSAKLAAESGQHVSVLREMVCSPAGTTIAATNAFDKAAVRAAIVKGVLKSAKRSQELGD